MEITENTRFDLATNSLLRAPDTDLRAVGSLPNLFVVGAPKAGTTAIYYYFKSHPQVFVSPRKEINYMAFYDGLPPLRGPGDESIVARNSVTTLADYEGLYAGRTIELIAADTSPAYLRSAAAAARITKLCADAKIVIVLRNPIESAFSMYSMLRRDRREPCRTFREAWERTPERIAAGWDTCWDYQGEYLFARQVERYLKMFPRGQLFIRRYEELKTQPVKFYRQLCEFAGISEIDVATANRQVNVGATKRDLIRTRKIGRWALRAARVAGIIVPCSWKSALHRRYLAPPAFHLNREDREMLLNHFGRDILELSALLDWDLSDWLKP
jgi:hypothetical protein